MGTYTKKHVVLPTKDMVSNIEAILTDNEDYDILIGMDIINLGEFLFSNKNGKSDLYFYCISLEEWCNWKTKFSTSSWGGKHKLPAAFTERGLYMLATILKGGRGACNKYFPHFNLKRSI